MGVSCDGCGRFAEEDSTTIAWADPHQAFLVAYDEATYRQIDGAHFCPACWTYDDATEPTVRTDPPDVEP